VLVDRALARFDEEKADLESVTLWRGKSPESLEWELVEEISESGESQWGFSRGRLALQNPETALARERNSLAPEHRFTDARLSIENKSCGSAVSALEDMLDSSLLPSSAEQLRPRHSFELSARNQVNRRIYTRSPGPAPWRSLRPVA
jgi:hypothetical protein